MFNRWKEWPLTSVRSKDDDTITTSKTRTKKIVGQKNMGAVYFRGIRRSTTTSSDETIDYY